MPKVVIKGEDGFAEVPVGTTLYEVSKRVSLKFKYPILVAVCNNVISNLHTPITGDCVVEFFDRSSAIGGRVYSRSLEFLVMACSSLVFGNPNDVLIDYTLDNGIYCEVRNRKITKDDVKVIERKMREFVNLGIDYECITVNKLDAMRYFESVGQVDKVENLRYLSSSTMRLYKVSKYYDYFFGPVAHDTGQTDVFDLVYLDDSCFVICFPKDFDDLTDFVHHEKLFDEYRKYQSWSRQVNLNLSSDLNKLGTLGKYSEAVSLSETHYDDQLSLVAEDIKNKRDRIKLILLSGPSSSGKTTTSKKLKTHLKVRGISVHEISLDNYFVNRENTPKDSDGNYDYASLQALDLDLFNEQMQMLLNGEEVMLPVYNFVKGEREFDGNKLRLSDGEILLIEGIHTLNDELTKYISRDNKYKIFINPLTPLKIDNHNRVHSADLRKLRRIVRDNNFRGRSAEETLSLWPNVVKEARDCIYPYQDSVDMIVNSSLNYEIGVLKIYAEPLLFAIDEDSDFYAEAHRLIYLLRNFLPISSELVPQDSVLREFIGISNIDF